MLLLPYERETVINYNQADQEASIYTFDPKLIARLEKLASKYPQMFHQKHKGNFGEVTYTIPKKYLSIREPVSEERRQAARERAILCLRPEENIPNRKQNPKLQNKLLYFTLHPLFQGFLSLNFLNRRRKPLCIKLILTSIK